MSKAAFFLLAAIIACTGCRKEKQGEKFTGIENISFENYPRVDGSTSSYILNVTVACKMLGVPYQWVAPGISSEWILQPVYEKIPEKYYSFFWQRLKSSKTHDAFINLVDGSADIILRSSTASPDEKAYADAAGVTVMETPVASDAFVFLVNKKNPVRSLTVEQIRKIYTGEITNWSQVGGKNVAIKVFTRPRNSGSEEVFRALVMGNLEPANFPASAIGGMAGVFTEVRGEENAICYTFNNYKNLQARIPDSEVPKIAINGIFPGESTIKNGTYSFITKLYVAIRSDVDHHSIAYKLYEWLRSADAKPTLAECGFIPE
ncbi:PstS family phosphate ABC transporter substrate-binding protein [Niabella aquatica]